MIPQWQRAVIETVRAHRFPKGIARFISLDAERPWVHVNVFDGVTTRMLIVDGPTSAEVIGQNLDAAISALAGRPVLDVANMGRG